jgi:hypothetical protein
LGKISSIVVYGVAPSKYVLKSFIPISGIKYAAVGRKLYGVDGFEKVWREYMNK